eukprot:gene8167-8358_t
MTTTGAPGNQIYNSMGLQHHIPAGPYAGPRFDTTRGDGRAFAGYGGRYGGRPGARSDGPGFRYSGGRCGVGGRGTHRAPGRGPPVSAGAGGPVPWVKQGCWLLPRPGSAGAAGVGTVIVDNTNLQPWQYEKYVRAAWAAGYQVKEEVMGEFTEAAAAEYAIRNIHGVSYEKLLVMLDQWRQQN